MIIRKNADATVAVTLSPNEAKHLNEVCEHAHASMTARAERLDQLGQFAMAVEDRHLATFADLLNRQIGLAISRPVPHGAAPKRPDIQPADLDCTFRTGLLPETLTRLDITNALGFAPNLAPSGDGKVDDCWHFTIDGEPCGIWDYKGSRWSVYDPSGAVARLFKAEPLPFLRASRF